MSKYDYSKSCSNRIYHVRIGQCNGLVCATGVGSAFRQMADMLDPADQFEYHSADVSCRQLSGQKFVINVRLCDNETLKIRASRLAMVMGEQIISVDRGHYKDDEVSNDQDA